jgi:hypothetical protein
MCGSLEQDLVGDEPSARGQTVLFYFTTRSATERFFFFFFKDEERKMNKDER